MILQPVRNTFGVRTPFSWQQCLTWVLFLIHCEFSFCFDAIISLLKRKKRKIMARLCNIVLPKALLDFPNKLKSCT